jgi:hypothetical protein
LKLYRTKADDHGPMRVCVDTACVTVENESTTTQWNQMVIIATNLVYGTHKRTRLIPPLRSYPKVSTTGVCGRAMVCGAITAMTGR